MPNVRIRYGKTTDNKLVSRRVFTLNNGKQVKVFLDPDNMKYSIVVADESEMLKIGGQTTNLAVLKIQAKNALQGLGVQFAEEKRNRTETTNV